MRLFQNAGVYLRYREQIDTKLGTSCSFEERRGEYLRDRYGALHLLKPVIENDQDAFFTNGDDPHLQQAWARGQGMPASSSLTDILLAQIEAHRTEVFYNLDPMRYGNDFLRRLPGSVRHAIAWRTAPSGNADFGGYGAILSNLPSFLRIFEQRGWRPAHFSPAHDPVMDSYAAVDERPIDVLFVGGYSRYHRQRAEVLEKAAALSGKVAVRFHLDLSRLTRLAESPFGLLPPLSKHRRPRRIRSLSRGPVFGLELYEAISKAKIVLNGSLDMAGEDRGNMRCFETMGCGALMISDTGNYPAGFEDGTNMLTYRDADDAVRLIEAALADPQWSRVMAQAGHQLVSSKYGKEEQWNRFVRIVEAL